MTDTRKVGIQLDGKDNASREINQVRGTLKDLEADMRSLTKYAAAGFLAITAGAGLAMKAAGESQQTWKLLDDQLRNSGVQFRAVRRDIEAVARELQDFTRYGDEDTAQVLTTLVGITDDYTRSIANIELVYDVAVGKMKGDFHAAAQLVGRVMMGQTSMLQRYGIVVEEGADALEVLRSRFGGIARGEGQNFLVWLVKIRNEFGDWLEELGKGLIEHPRLTGALERGRDALKDLTTWTANNRATLDRWIATGIDAAEQVLEIVIGTGKWVLAHRELLVDLGKTAVFVLLARRIMDVVIVMRTAALAAGSLGFAGALSSLAALVTPAGALLAGLGLVAFAIIRIRREAKDAGFDVDTFRGSLRQLGADSTEFLINRLETQRRELQGQLDALNATAPGARSTAGMDPESARVAHYADQARLKKWRQDNAAEINSITASVEALSQQLEAARAHLANLKAEAAGAPPPAGGAPAGGAGRRRSTPQLGKPGVVGVGAPGLPQIRDVDFLQFQEKHFGPVHQAARQEMLETMRTAEMFQQQLEATFGAHTINLIEGFGESIAQSFTDVGGAFRGLVGMVASAVGDMMITAGTGIVLTSEAFATFKRGLLSLFPEKGIAAGIALIAAGAAFKAGVRTFLSNPTGGAGGALAGGSMQDFQQSLRGPGTDAGPITLVIQGGLLDASDPRQADALANALQRLASRRVIVQVAPA